MSNDQASSSDTRKQPPQPTCKNCGYSIRKTEQGWAHVRPLSLRLKGCVDAQPTEPEPSDLEQVCLNLIEETQIDDAGQRNVEQYFDQINDILKERGFQIPNLKE